MNDHSYQQALALLRKALADPTATFHAGQWEAIERLVTQRARLLVVQRTGWGKSLVYFLATRLLRDQGARPTLRISPLLALMRDQIRAAGRIGVRAETVNSSNTEAWNAVRDRLLANEIDLLLISPERLANDTFRDTYLMPIAGRIGLLVGASTPRWCKLSASLSAPVGTQPRPRRGSPAFPRTTIRARDVQWQYVNT